MSKQGFFVTFEGGEGVGKTTLIDSLSLSLEKQGLSILKTRAPGGTRLGQEIRNLLLHYDKEKLDARAELLLFLADRSQHVQEVILPALQVGKVVLCDRFNDSTIAYQGAARGLSEAVVSDLCRFACFDLKPDLTFYLNLDPAQGFQRAAASRTHKDRIESEEIAFHHKIQQAFLHLANQDKKRIICLDASLPKEVVLQSAQEKLNAFFLSHR